MSGGLDSASVAVTAADLLKHEGRDLTAFSCIPLREFKAVRPEGQIYDESHYVEAVKEANDTIGGRYIQARRLNLFTDLDELFWLICCPIRNPGYYPWLVAMSRQARSAKIRAMLTGQRGNLFFSQSGQGHVVELATRGHWWRVLREVAAYSRRVEHSFWRVLKGRVLYPLVPLNMLRLWSRLKHGKRPPWWTMFPLNSDFAREMDPVAKRRALGLDPYWRPRPQWRRETAQAFYALVNDVAIIENGQRLGFGFDMPDPTGDMRLVEFCHGLPGDQFLRHGESRRLVREAMRGLLPEKVRTRTLFGFQGADLCLRMSPLRRDIGDLLLQFQGSERLRHYLDIPRLNLLWKTWEEREQSDSFSVFFQGQEVLARGVLVGRFLQWFDSKASSLNQTPLDTRP